MTLIHKLIQSHQQPLRKECVDTPSQQEARHHLARGHITRSDQQVWESKAELSTCSERAIVWGFSPLKPPTRVIPQAWWAWADSLSCSGAWIGQQCHLLATWLIYWVGNKCTPQSLALRPSEMNCVFMGWEPRDSIMPLLVHSMARSSKNGLSQTWVQFLPGPLPNCVILTNPLSLRCLIYKMGI